VFYDQRQEKFKTGDNRDDYIQGITALIGEPGNILVDEIPFQGVLPRFFRSCHQSRAENRCAGEGHVFVYRSAVVVLWQLYHQFLSLIIPMKPQAHRVLPICRPGHGASVLY